MREHGQPADKFPETEVPQCANMMRLPRQATRISFKLTTSYPRSLIATALLVFYDMGHFSGSGCRIHTPFIIPLIYL